MAITCSLFAISLLLLSLLVSASANDYNYDSSKNQPYDTKPMSTGDEKPDYGTKPDSYKPQPVSSEEVNYSTKPDSYKPKPGESTYGEEEKPANYGTELPQSHPTKPEEALPIGVEGLVLCKSGPKYTPIQGALARITCVAVDENGYKKTYSFRCGETDAKGYFFSTLSSLGLDDYNQLKPTECKVFLESSPLETCNGPVDVNKGISGAPLSDYRVLDQKSLKLYSVGPFFFTSQPNTAPKGGY